MGECYEKADGNIFLLLLPTTKMLWKEKMRQQVSKYADVAIGSYVFISHACKGNIRKNIGKPMKQSPSHSDGVLFMLKKHLNFFE